MAVTVGQRHRLNKIGQTQERTINYVRNSVAVGHHVKGGIGQVIGHGIGRISPIIIQTDWLVNIGRPPVICYLGSKEAIRGQSPRRKLVAIIKIRLILIPVGAVG